jgi:putative two-component system response regulator
MIAVLGTLVEHRDLESGEHINRVKAYTEIMANELMKQFPEYNLTEHDIKIIVAASPLHYIMNARDSISLRDARADGSSPVGLLHMI